MTTTKASVWSVTINNPTAADEEEIALARQKGWQVDGQLEKGTEGTPHYQLIVRTGQVRFSAVKKQFTRAHIEVCRNPAALQQYVHKQDTREGALKTDNKFYPSLSKTWQLWYQYADDSTSDGKWIWWDTKQVENSWNEFCKHSIENGFHIEGIAVNPSTICCVRRFGLQILIRACSEVSTDPVDNQTDSHTDETSLHSNQSEEA